MKLKLTDDEIKTLLGQSLGRFFGMPALTYDPVDRVVLYQEGNCFNKESRKSFKKCYLDDSVWPTVLISWRKPNLSIMKNAIKRLEKRINYYIRLGKMEEE